MNLLKNHRCKEVTLSSVSHSEREQQFDLNKFVCSIRPNEIYAAEKL
jgi:hypothetical protein